MNTMHSIVKKALKASYASVVKAQVYTDMITQTLVFLGLYPEKNDYIDYAIPNEILFPIFKLEDI